VNGVVNTGNGAAAHACVDADPSIAAPVATFAGDSPADAMTVPRCVCCGWSMGALDVATPGRDGLCLLCEIAGCTAAVIGPGVVRPEVHRRLVERRVGS
jgi:hypothetical protein